jgi:ubiquinone biosynthesis protein UbiJ
MLDTLQRLAATAFLQRATLGINHVLSSEEAAVRRLRPHAGRCIALQFDAWPSLLPVLPELRFVVTPAGLLEWVGGDPLQPDADLRLAVDASNPARSIVQGLAGERPAVEVSGDAMLAADVSWLMDNLRWDVQDDLARVIGAAPAHELARIGGKLAGGLRAAVSSLAALATRERGGSQVPGAQ